MSAVCRLATAVVLLLHLIFGCSLRHAAACATHGHDGCEHTCAAVDSPSVQSGHCCSHNHGNGSSDDGSAAELTKEVGRLIAPCCACESQPCDGNHPGCHGEAECSFVPSSDVVFVIDAPFVVFLTYDHDPMKSYVGSLALRGLHQRSAVGAQDSLSRCASLCTWLI